MSQLVTRETETKEAMRGYKDLKKYADILRRIENAEVRISDYKETMYSPATSKLSEMPKVAGDGTSKQEQVVLTLERMNEQLQRLIAAEADQYDRITAALSRLEDPDDEQLLTLRYMDGAEWKKVAESLFRDKDDFDENPEKYIKRAYRIHVVALQRLEDVYKEIYPITEEMATSREAE